ncbi:hypothetical protein GCM10017600_36850 [Streptosporangium carneum]|uniref:Uncharacterized protein n=1 Tax=Streptosporangium carneum TaxID=47481 RepID=A0A9W6I3G6_9ACTN|nr:hypothetical protein GCM10017600_36850 [Streptosporangium carneum]
MAFGLVPAGRDPNRAVGAARRVNTARSPARTPGAGVPGVGFGRAPEAGVEPGADVPEAGVEPGADVPEAGVELGADVPEAGVEPVLEIGLKGPDSAWPRRAGST